VTDVRQLLWSLAAAAALLWPAHVVGPLDGIPLDTRVEAIAIGLVFPVLLWLHPRFLRSAIARAPVIALLALKLATSQLLAQEGWCARFITPAPLQAETSAIQLTWDARADWRHHVPSCSAIVARPYTELASFPAWFLNLLGAHGQPPAAIVAMTVDGYLSPTSAGTFTLEVPDGQVVHGMIDDRPIDASTPLALAAGRHPVHLETVFSGNTWRFEPRWNGADAFSAVLTTTRPPTALDEAARPAVRLLTWFVAALLLASWTIAAWRERAFSLPASAWVCGATLACVAAGLAGNLSAQRIAVALLAGAALCRVPDRSRDARAAFLLVGVPWLALIVAATLSHIGRFDLYSPGDDFTMFQRFAHRIYMQGYWLEGGQETFWFQPLYRWIVGALHLVFGDSSVGERYLDAVALAAGAQFAFVVASRVVSFEWGTAAAALTLATVALSPAWWVIGRGLSEIASAGFAYAAALLLIGPSAVRLKPGTTGVSSSPGAVGSAALLALLAFYTRLNNLPFVISLVAMTLPFDVTAASLWRPRTWIARVPVRRALAVLGCLAIGLVLFAWRTWHYTGVFSLFAGTQQEQRATVQPTDSLGMAAIHVVQSLLVIMTVQDPPAFDPRALLVIVGVVTAALALLRTPLCRDLPAGPVLLCLGAIAGSLVSRGTAYVGRFSIHVMPIATALAVSAAGLMWRRRSSRRRTGGPVRQDGHRVVVVTPLRQKREAARLRGRENAERRR
jgi:hypothetical protein